MKTSTLQVIDSLLKADETVSATERNAILAIARGETPEKASLDTARLLSRSEVAKLTGKTPQWVDWAFRRYPALLERVQLPGSSRAAGYTYASVRRLLTTISKEA